MTFGPLRVLWYYYCSVLLGATTALPLLFHHHFSHPPFLHHFSTISPTTTTTTTRVFPLKGKLLNVRDASKKQLLGNAEVQNIMKIMGLKLDTKYVNSDDAWWWYSWWDCWWYSCVVLVRGTRGGTRAGTSTTDHTMQIQAWRTV